MSESKEPLAPKFFLILGVAVVIALIYFVTPDISYFLQPASLRPLHPHHDFWRSSGYGGLSFGVAATVLILLNLTYLLRKQLVTVSWLGGLRSWMAFHVFTGLLAGTLVLLHSTFQPKSALGSLAFWAIAIVVVTGLIGRYIYAHTPRSIEGRELGLEEIRRRMEEYQSRLEKLGMPQDFFNRPLKPVTAQAADSGIFSALWGLLAGDRELKREYKELRYAITHSLALRPVAGDILPLALRYTQERQWLRRYNELRGLMGSWRFLHRWLAILLVVAVVFHIFVAYRMGNLWIFKGLP